MFPVRGPNFAIYGTEYAGIVQGVAGRCHPHLKATYEDRQVGANHNCVREGSLTYLRREMGGS